MNINMKNASLEAWGDFTKHIRKPEDCLQAGIDAAYIPFNIEDENTYPKTPYAPSGMSWLTWDKCYLPGFNVATHLRKWKTYGDEINDFMWSDTIYYCDPADLIHSTLLPVRIKL